MADENSVLFELLGDGSPLIETLKSVTAAMDTFATSMAAAMEKLSTSIETLSGKIAGSLKSVKDAAIDATSDKGLDNSFENRLKSILTILQTQKGTSIKITLDESDFKKGLSNIRVELQAGLTTIAEDSKSALAPIANEISKLLEESVGKSISKQKQALSAAKSVYVQYQQEIEKAEKDSAKERESLYRESQSAIERLTKQGNEKLIAQVKELANIQRGEAAEEINLRRSVLEELLNTDRQEIASSKIKTALDTDRIKTINLAKDARIAAVKAGLDVEQGALQEELNNIGKFKRSKLESYNEVLQARIGAINLEKTAEGEAISFLDKINSAFTNKQIKQIQEEISARQHALDIQKASAAGGTGTTEAAQEAAIRKLDALEKSLNTARTQAIKQDNQLILQSIDQLIARVKAAGAEAPKSFFVDARADLRFINGELREQATEIKTSILAQKEYASVVKQSEVAIQQAASQGNVALQSRLTVLRESLDIFKGNLGLTKDIKEAIDQVSAALAKEATEIDKVINAYKTDENLSVAEREHKQSIESITNEYKKLYGELLTVEEAERELERLSKLSIDGNVKAAKKSAEDAEREFSHLIGTLQNVGRTLQFAGSIATAGLGTAINSVVTYTEKIRGLSEETGLSFEQTQKFAGALRSFGVSTQLAERAMKTLAQAVEEAKNGSVTAIDKFREIGITQEQLAANNYDLVQTFGLVSSRLGSIEDPARKTAAAVHLLGRTGYDLLPAFQQGGAAIEAAMKKVTPLTEQQNKSLVDLTIRVEEFKNSVLLAVASFLESAKPAFESIFGVVTKVIDGFNTLSEPLKNSISQVAVLGVAFAVVGGTLITATTSLLSFAAALALPAFLTAPITIEAIVVATNVLADTLFVATNNLLAFIGPWGLLFAAIGAVVVAYQSYTTSVVTAQAAADKYISSSHEAEVFLSKYNDALSSNSEELSKNVDVMSRSSHLVQILKDDIDKLAGKTDEASVALRAFRQEQLQHLQAAKAVNESGPRGAQIETIKQISQHIKEQIELLKDQAREGKLSYEELTIARTKLFGEIRNQGNGLDFSQRIKLEGEADDGLFKLQSENSKKRKELYNTDSKAEVQTVKETIGKVTAETKPAAQKQLDDYIANSEERLRILASEHVNTKDLETKLKEEKQRLQHELNQNVQNDANVRLKILRENFLIEVKEGKIKNDKQVEDYKNAVIQLIAESTVSATKRAALETNLNRDLLAINSRRIKNQLDEERTADQEEAILQREKLDRAKSLRDANIEIARSKSTVQFAQQEIALDQQIADGKLTQAQAETVRFHLKQSQHEAEIKFLQEELSSRKTYDNEIIQDENQVSTSLLEKRKRLVDQYNLLSANGADVDEKIRQELAIKVKQIDSELVQSYEKSSKAQIDIAKSTNQTELKLAQEKDQQIKASLEETKKAQAQKFNEFNSVFDFLKKEGSLSKETLESLQQQIGESVKATLAQLGPEALVNDEFQKRLGLFEKISSELDAVEKQAKKGTGTFTEFFHSFNLGSINELDKNGTVKKITDDFFKLGEEGKNFGKFSISGGNTVASFNEVLKNLGSQLASENGLVGSTAKLNDKFTTLLNTVTDLSDALNDTKRGKTEGDTKDKAGAGGDKGGTPEAEPGNPNVPKSVGNLSDDKLKSPTIAPVTFTPVTNDRTKDEKQETQLQKVTSTVSSSIEKIDNAIGGFSKFVIENGGLRKVNPITDTAELAKKLIQSNNPVFPGDRVPDSINQNRNSQVGATHNTQIEATIAIGDKGVPANGKIAYLAGEISKEAQVLGLAGIFGGNFGFQNQTNAIQGAPPSG